MRTERETERALLEHHPLLALHASRIAAPSVGTISAPSGPSIQKALSRLCGYKTSRPQPAYITRTLGLKPSRQARPGTE